MSEGGYKYSGRLSIRMPTGLHRELAHTAAEQKVSMNQFMCVAIASALERMSSDSLKRPYSGPTSGMPEVGPDFDTIMRSMGYDDNDF